MPVSGPLGFAPPIPGMTGGEGTAPGQADPMQMVAMMLGMSPAGKDTTTEKMSKVVQLLREVAKEDPRISSLVTDALKLLVEGPGQGQPAQQQTQGGPMPQPGGSMPVGGPGATPF